LPGVCNWCLKGKFGEDGKARTGGPLVWWGLKYQRRDARREERARRAITAPPTFPKGKSFYSGGLKPPAGAGRGLGWPAPKIRGRLMLAGEFPGAERGWKEAKWYKLTGPPLTKKESGTLGPSYFGMRIGSMMNFSASCWFFVGGNGTPLPAALGPERTWIGRGHEFAPAGPFSRDGNGPGRGVCDQCGTFVASLVPF